MAREPSSMPMPFEASIHLLEGKALRKWWQDPLCVRRQDGYYNDGINFSLIPLLFIPILEIVIYQKFGATKAIVPGFLFWMGCLLLLFSFFRRHRYHALKVEVSQTGLTVKSPFLERKIHWSDIEDFYLAGTVEPKEYVIQCKNAEEFFLSKDLTGSADLFKLISQRITYPATGYELNYRIQDGYFDGSRATAFIVIVAALMAFGQLLLDPSSLGTIDLANLISLIFLVLVFTLSLAWCWLNLSKTPQVIRAGHLGLYIRTGTQSKVIPWDRITGIRQILSWLVINSNSGWFVILASEKEPMTKKLLEYKWNLLRH